ncbi:MAG: DUF1080 domain-containing protein [Acidobacteria bacterium]|nr:DUF1080 domain-containing protein [Acidobacteriota bacterium]
MSRVLSAGARFVMVWAIAALASAWTTGAQTLNTLTDEEKAAGWKLLFDGQSTAGWRGFKSEMAPDGWTAVDGLLTRVGRGGDLLTIEEFGDFELRLDWKIEKGGNSGIFYRGVEDSEAIYWSAPEMQILDNGGHRDGKNSATSAGSNYALHAPVRDVTKPIGEWNEVRIVAKGAHVEHWMNGVKLLEYELWSPEWEALVKASKFKEHPGYGRAKKGHIGLQDHGNPIWFRNIKIRPL